MSEDAKAKQEKLKKEQEEARKALEQAFQNSAPRNAREGLGNGINNIVGGALGGVGIVVLAPTAGLALGLKNGGLFGGAIGVTGGLVVGVLGGVGLILGGAISGVSQVVRGVVAAPKAYQAQQEGKGEAEDGMRDKEEDGR